MRVQNERDHAMKQRHRHIGSSPGDSLHEGGILDDARAVAMDEELAFF
jgi:hypothetical protein